MLIAVDIVIDKEVERNADLMSKRLFWTRVTYLSDLLRDVCAIVKASLFVVSKNTRHFR